MYFDSHAHLTSPQITDLEDILERATKNQVSKIVNICTDISTLEKGLILSSHHPYIYNAAATTPHDVEQEGDIFFPRVQQLANEKKLIAIGETGLDYHYEYSPRAIQKKYFVLYLHLALENKLPILIHCREAFCDLFDITAEEYREAPLLLHCFTGTNEEAIKAVDRGWFISFSGILTFKKSETLRETLKEIPLDRILVETDAPYLAPHSKRGLPNEPAFLPETVAVVAALKGISIEEAGQITFNNACRFFRIPQMEVC